MSQQYYSAEYVGEQFASISYVFANALASSPARPEKTEKLAKERIKRMQVSDALRRAVLPKDAWRYENCCQAGMGWVEYCSSCERHDPTQDFHHRFIPLRCMLRICPNCAPMLAGSVQERYMPYFQRLLDEKIPASWENPELPAGVDTGFKLVTLTRSVSLLGSEEQMKKAITETLEAAHALVKRMGWDSGGAGAIATLEVGPTGLKLHAHLTVYGPYRWKSQGLHILYCKKKRLRHVPDPHGYISETWQELTGDPVVHIRGLADLKAVRYGLKYVVKGTHELSPEMLVKLHLALRGKRRVRAWGCFYNLKAEPEERDPSAGHCPTCGEKLDWVPRGFFDRLLRQHITWFALEYGGLSIDLIRTSKSGEGSLPPPLWKDERIDSNGFWLDNSLF